MSFLDKLKVKIEENEYKSKKSGEVEVKKVNSENSDFLQLDVDIYESAKNIIIVAPMPGVDVSELDINIENENDVITIQGERIMPETGEDNMQMLRKECSWGRFYRQIILPQEINVEKVDARVKKGILILTLPLLRLQGRGKKRIEVKNEGLKK